MTQNSKPPADQRGAADDPIARFQETMERAKSASAFDPTAMSLGTADSQGRPSVRVVLLKDAGPRGFVFFTNRESRKGEELRSNPRAALCLHWPAIGEQVRIEGTVELVSDAESDEYFVTRPRESQIAAWASQQSRPAPSRAELEERFRALAEHYHGKTVPRPPWWGGYRVLPESIEFWHHREHRLHDRTLYAREGEGWRVEILDP